MPNRIKKEMEYEDAPSGYVTLYSYKEPFMKYDSGFGFRGVLLFDGASDRIQCHICGEWYLALSRHVGSAHGLTAADYKSKVGLRQTTALIGEVMRSKLVASGLDKRLQNLRNRGRMSEETKEKIRKTNLKNRFVTENQNEHGTCPEQLIDRLLKECQKQGKTPTERSLQFKEALITVFGTYRNACDIAGIKPNKKVKDTDKHFNFSSNNFKAFVIAFETMHGRKPSPSDIRRGIVPTVLSEV